MNDYIKIAEASKMELLEYRQGYTRKGCVDMCRNCRGLGTETELVSAAVQLPQISSPRSTAASNTQKALVSICVPVYNTAKYLARCVKSLLNQTFANIEVVLVDDGSNDDSGQICDEFARADNRVRTVHKPNGGEASARNAGLKVASGKYVMFIDSDDEYLPDAVRLMVEAVKANAADLVIGGYLEQGEESERFATGHQRRYTAAEIAKAYLTEKCQYSMPYIASTVNAKLFRRDVLTENAVVFDERFVIGNDALFMCEYLKHIDVIYDVLSPIYIYYKFRPEERVQGMAWYYPDGFFLFAHVADRMIKLAHLDAMEYKKLLAKEYKDFLYALTNAAVNESLLKNGIMPYFESILDEIELVGVGAKLTIEENLIVQEAGDLPFRYISYLITEKRYEELWKLLKYLGAERGMTPYKGGTTRQMISVKAAMPSALEMKKDTIITDALECLLDKLITKQSQIKELEERANASDIWNGVLTAQNSEATAKTIQLEEQNKEAAVKISQLEQQNSETAAKTIQLEEQNKEAAVKISQLEQQNSEATAQILQLEEQNKEAAVKISQLEQQNSETAAKTIQLEEQNTEAAVKISQLEQQNNALMSSRSWRLTEPLRKLKASMFGRK